MNLDTIAGWLAPGIIQALWQGSLLAVLSAILIRFSKFSASTRSAIWMATLFVVAVLPFHSIFAKYEQSETVRVTHQAPVAINGVTTYVTEKETSASIPMNVAKTVIVLWLAGTCFQLIRLLYALKKLLRFKKDAVPISTSVQYPRGARICSSKSCETPVAIGFFHPAILLPFHMARSLEPEDLNRIVRHEVAHLLRRDDWLQLMQRLVEAMFFFHPAIWWIGRKLELEREIACDDYVINNPGENKKYARSLIRLAERESGMPSHNAAPAIFSHRNQLSRRIEMILTSNRNRSSRMSKPGIAIAILSLAISLFLFSRVSPVVAVADDLSHLRQDAVQQGEKRIRQAEIDTMRAEESIRRAEEKLQRAEEKMRLTSERMERVSQQLKRTEDRFRSISARPYAVVTVLPGTPSRPSLPEIPSMVEAPAALARMAPVVAVEPAIAVPAPAALPRPAREPLPALAPAPEVPALEARPEMPEMPVVPDTPEAPDPIID